MTQLMKGSVNNGGHTSPNRFIGGMAPGTIRTGAKANSVGPCLAARMLGMRKFAASFLQLGCKHESGSLGEAPLCTWAQEAFAPYKDMIVASWELNANKPNTFRGVCIVHELAHTISII